MIEILNRYTKVVLYKADVPDVRAAVLQAVKDKADLSMANLSRADLSMANLSEANLSRADLSRADLSMANLSEANLSRADLSRADLSMANLSEANLSRADLSMANLSWADLSRADLSEVRRDIMAVLDASPSEVHGLRDTLAGGHIDGSCYDGECCCLVGTIAKLRHVGINDLPGRLPDSSSPAERWFLALRPGYTPENSQVAAITLQWIDEWLAEHAAPVQAAQANESAADPTP